MKILIYILLLIPLVSYTQDYEYDYSIKKEKKNGIFYIIGSDPYGGYINYKDSILTITSKYDSSQTVLNCIKLDEFTYTNRQTYKVKINKEYIEFLYKVDINKKGYSNKLIMYIKPN